VLLSRALLSSAEESLRLRGRTQTFAASTVAAVAAARSSAVASVAVAATS
jgi:hypothetical protein